MKQKRERTKMSETKLLASSLQHKWNDTGTDMRTKGEMRERRRGRQEVETEVKKTWMW